MPKENWVSLNEIFEAAKQHMLNGRDPKTPKDWALIINFIAYNISAGLELPATKLIARLFGAPLGEKYIEDIVNHQIDLNKRDKRKQN